MGNHYFAHKFSIIIAKQQKVLSITVNLLLACIHIFNNVDDFVPCSFLHLLLV